MKGKFFTAVFLASVVLTAAGCTEAPVAQVEKVNVPKVKQIQPVSLKHVLAENSAALDFADLPYDPLIADGFLLAINAAKDRDYQEYQRTLTASLAGQVDDLQASAGQANNGSTDNQNSGNNNNAPANTPAAPSADDENQADDDDKEAGVVHYVNSSLGFEIDLPEGWEQGSSASENADLVTAQSPAENSDDVFRENLRISVEELPIALTAKEYADVVLASLNASLDDFKTESSVDSELDGQAAKKVVYTHKDGATQFKSVLYITVAGYRGYIVQGQALADSYSRFSETFGKAADSFNIL